MLELGVDISSVNTHRFWWRDFPKGFDVMTSVQTGEVILDWRDMS
jgi:threonine 3-dehydrogenase